MITQALNPLLDGEMAQMYRHELEQETRLYRLARAPKARQPRAQGRRVPDFGQLLVAFRLQPSDVKE